MSLSRRKFLVGLGVAGTLAAVPRAARASAACPFRLAVINDEISQDFDHACSVVSKDFGLSWIELRSLWGKSITALDSGEVDKARQILAKYKLRVTDIGSPLFKVNWPGAPLSKESPHRDPAKVEAEFKKQDALLEHSIELCKTFETDRIRCFDFWRIADQKPYREAINDKLRQAARLCAKSKVILLLENEMACNTGSGPEAVEILKAVTEPSFMLNWDPGNSATFPGDTPYPNDYKLLPRHRIGHCHVKDTIRKPDGTFEWAPVGGGIIDWVGQFRALQREGYHHGVSLETHWHGGKPEPGSTMSVGEVSTRISMKGLKQTLAKAGISC
jgi:sugar phosphate isomerase/epimerase